MGRVEAAGMQASPTLQRLPTTGKSDAVLAASARPRVDAWPDVTVFSDGDSALRVTVIGAERRKLLIFDWFHVSEAGPPHRAGLRKAASVDEPECVSCLTSAYFHVPRLRHRPSFGALGSVKPAMPSRR